MNDWISVEDRLPDEGATCLVFFHNKTTGDKWPGVSTYYKSPWNGKWMEFHTHITHWMTLPPPPEQDND